MFFCRIHENKNPVQSDLRLQELQSIPIHKHKSFEFACKTVSKILRLPKRVPKVAKKTKENAKNLKNKSKIVLKV